jgi:hypothetical protein
MTINIEQCQVHNNLLLLIPFSLSSSANLRSYYSCCSNSFFALSASFNLFRASGFQCSVRAFWKASMATSYSLEHLASLARAVPFLVKALPIILKSARSSLPLSTALSQSFMHLSNWREKWYYISIKENKYYQNNSGCWNWNKHKS